jgi:hypothetical protein
MTIAIAIAVPDGIALAADTQTTWYQTINKAKDKATGNEFELAEPIRQPAGWSKMASKLFPTTFGDIKFAICTAGASSLNRKTMYAVFKSLERSFTGDVNYERIANHLIEGLKEELRKHQNVDILSEAPFLACNFILAGFEDNDVSRPVLQSHVVFSGKRTVNGAEDASGHFIWWKNDPNNRYGCCWIGETEFCSHIVNHRNKNLPAISGQYFLMSLADAVDYTKFLVEFTCDFQRFAVMVPDCARPIISATLTPEGYKSEVLA